MVLILGIKFLQFSSVENSREYLEISEGECYGTLFGCLSFQRLKLKSFSEKVGIFIRISYLSSGLFFLLSLLNGALGEPIASHATESALPVLYIFSLFTAE